MKVSNSLQRNSSSNIILHIEKYLQAQMKGLMKSVIFRNKNSSTLLPHPGARAAEREDT